MITSGSVTAGTVSPTLVYSTPDGVKTNLFLNPGDDASLGGTLAQCVIGDDTISVSGASLVSGFPTPAGVTELTGFTGSLYAIAWPYGGNDTIQVNFLATDDR